MIDGNRCSTVVKLSIVYASILLTSISCIPNFDFTPAPTPEPVSLFSQTLDVVVTDARLDKLNPPGVNSSAVGATMNLFIGFDVLNSSESFVALRDLDYTVFLAGYQIDRNRLSDDQLGISEGSRQHFEFPINLNIQDNPELLNQALQILDGNRVSMRVMVEATTEDNLRQNLQDDQSISASARIIAPTISMLDMELLTGRQLLLKFQAENVGGVGYILSSQRLNLRQDTQSIARADIFNIQVPAQTTKSFEVIFDLEGDFNPSNEIDISSDWLFDVLGAGSFRIEDWFFRTILNIN